MSGPSALPETIRHARRARGLSLRELAGLIAVSPATLSAIENGKTGVSVDRLLEVAGALGIPPDHLLSGGPRADGSLTSVPRTPPAPALSADAPRTHWREFPALELDPVLAAAIEVFVETGYHGATMRALAARAGVSAPGVYHHFRDKQELLVRALDLTMDEIHWRVRAALAESDTTAARVGLAVEALALYHTHRRELAFIGASEMRSLESPNRDRIRAARNAVQHLLDAEIEAGVAAGDFTTAHPRDAGKAIVTMCTSLPQWFRIGGPSTPEQIAAEYSDFALTLLGKL